MRNALQMHKAAAAVIAARRAQISPEEFIRMVRANQIKKGIPLAGHDTLPKNARKAITDVAAKMFETYRGPYVGKDDAIDIMNRFELMGSRFSLYVTTNILRASIMTCLVSELEENCRTLNEKPKDLITYTIYHGSIGVLMNEFPQFKETPGVFSYAAIHYSYYTRKYLAELEGGEAWKLKRAQNFHQTYRKRAAARLSR